MFDNFGINLILKKYDPKDYAYRAELIVNHKSVDACRPSFNIWSLKDFKKQWREGLERLKSYNATCLIVYVDNENPSYPSVDLWAIFKNENNLTIIPQCLQDKISIRKLKSKEFTMANYYEFIRPKLTTTHDEDGNKYTQWFSKYDENKINKVIESLKDC